MRTAAALIALALPALANGTLETGGPVRLKAHVVHAKVFDRVAEVVVEHTFRNEGYRRLEGQYRFHLPGGATVSEFAMTMGGKMVKGAVMEKGRATRIYEGIVRRKKDPGLLHKVDRGVFRARVFPIEPRSDLTIRIGYQQLLPENAGTLEMRYPLGAGERVGVAISVDIESTVDLRTVYSPSHEVETRLDGKRRAYVAWERGPGKRAKKDFLLYIGRSKKAVAFSLLSHRQPAGKGTFLAVLAPVAEAAEKDILPRDVVYVLDTSGSMSGRKIEQAVDALKFGIESLRAHDRFNIVAFSSIATPFRRHMTAADRETKDAALAWIGKLEATGGTAIDEALQVALRMTDGDNLPIVTLLTDGLPSVGVRDPNYIVKRVEQANKANARVFVFGVGFDQNVAFLDRIARNTRAAREYITPEQDLEVVVSRFFRRIDQPVLSDLALDLGEGVSEVYPRRLPDLFAGDQLVVLGRYDTPGRRTIRLTGKLRGREVTYQYEGPLAEKKEIAPLPRLWAQKKVAFLLEQIELHGPDPELAGEIVRLGTKYTIVTKYTSGLVVEDEELEEVAGEDGGTAADAPFSGPTTNSSIGIGGGAGGGKRGRGGRRNLRAGGGSGLTQNSVELGLYWLAQAQDQTDGAWNDPGDTAWALLAYLGSGYTDRGSRRENRYARNVRMGLRYLMTSQRDDGSFGAGLKDHAFATLALCEARWITRNPRYLEPAQSALNWLAEQRGGDTLDHVYTVLALRAAKFAGLDHDPDGFERAARHFDKTPPESPAERAGVLLARILMGEDPRTSERLKTLAKSLELEGDDLHYLMLGSMACFQVGGVRWREWNRWMKKVIVPTQRKGSPWPGRDGVRITSARTICLQTYYRCDRVFGTR